MSENLKNTQSSESETINTSNIFDEFDSDSDLLSEVQKLKDESERDSYYYLSLATSILKSIFVILLFVNIFVGWYNYLQSNDTFSDKTFLNPVCNLLNWDVPIPSSISNCSSVSFTIKKYNEYIRTLKREQSDAVLPLITNIYQKENFTKTKEVSFLLDKSENKLDVLDILERFDKIKNDYVWLDKDKIECRDLIIDSEEMIMSMKCSSFSRWFESEIIWYTWEKTDTKLVGTSMSIANSFLNYIEKQTNDFKILERQKVFSNQSVTWERSWLTSKTDFDLKLKINF